jgi:molybdate-binding protein
MQLKFIKLTHQQYQLVIQHSDKIVLNRVLESKSFLRHDLMHYCIEKQAQLLSSFFGQY